jgi:hypothetical protein
VIPVDGNAGGNCFVNRFCSDEVQHNRDAAHLGRMDGEACDGTDVIFEL